MKENGRPIQNRNHQELGRLGKHISDDQLSELKLPASIEIHNEAGKLSSQLAVDTTENDQTCKFSGIGQA